ncbi:MAG: response regulator [Elusimicrobia bacterium]|nr:response regulator [Elusimicrobiota bacterium]
MNLLIIDDDPAHIEAIRRAFRAADAKTVVRAAATMGEYRRLVAAEPPDIALLDLTLPDGGALEALSLPPAAGPFPILIITCHGDEGRAVEAMKAGALDYIVKSPGAFADMPRTVKRALREWNLLQAHKRAEEALRAGEELFRLALQNSPIMVFQQDRELRYTKLFNPHRGFKPETTLGKRDEDLLVPEEAQRLTSLKRSVLETGVPARREVRAIIGGKPFFYELALEPIRGAGGHIAGITAVSLDITERRKMEEERRLISRWIMRVREEEKRRFSVVLHDAIGAMQVGLSSSLLLVEEEIKHGSAKRAVTRAEQTKKLVKWLAARMKDVCVDIWPPALETSGLQGALSELVLRFCARTRIKISHSISLPDDGKTSDNPAGIIIYRLVQEALNNAAKHSRAANLELIINHDAGKVLVSVSDDGRGFDALRLRFKKSSLGLKIMREDAESVGGSLSIDSKPGQGTVIRAEFPRWPAPCPKPELSNAH